MSSVHRQIGWSWFGAALLITVYGVTVCWMASLHEPWRDEVVPLSIARSAGSFAELVAPLKFESHPILWYFLIWCAWGIFRTSLVLKGASLVSAIASIALLSRSQLPRWFHWLFAFSFLPVYQYSVVSRGYSLEMFVLFLFCALYPRRRERPLAVALTLAALANTEAFGFIMAIGAGAMLLAECWVGELDWRQTLKDRWGKVAVLIYAGGLALAVVIAFPDSTHHNSTVRQLDPWAIAEVIGSAMAQPAAYLGPLGILPAPSFWLWAYFVYLLRRPPLLCYAFVGFVGFAVFFNIFPYLLATWRTGNAILLLVSVVWLDSSLPTVDTTGYTAALRYICLGRVLVVAMIVMFAGHVRFGVREFARERREDNSSNRALADVLRSDPRCANAVLMGEPDAPLAAVPYYADNRIYLGRENTYRAWSVFAPPRSRAYSLGDLLDAARRVRADCGCPVVITMGFDLANAGAGINYPGTPYEEEFTITPQQRDEFLASTLQLVRLDGPTITDETYDVFLLR